MPFPYSYYQDNYTGPIHATRFKAGAYVSTPVGTPIVTSGDINALEQSVLNFDTSGSNIVIDSLTGVQNGQIIEIVKMTAANSLTLKNQSGVGAGAKFFAAGNSDIVFPPTFLGGAYFIAIQDGAALKLFEIKTNTFGNGSQAFPSISFSTDYDNGLYLKAADTIGIVAGGLDKLIIASAFTSATTPIRFADGSLAAPAISFISDPDTGLLKDSNGVVLSLNGVEAFRFNYDGTIVHVNGTLKSNNPFQLFTVAGAAQKIYAGGVLVGDTYSTYTAQVPANGIFSQGNIKTNGQFQGTATSALYADLAENYESDALYAPGTLVKIGGVKEITLASDNAAFGVISTDPGFLLNAVQKKEAGALMLPVALAGKVPCRVIGLVKKGDKLGLSPNKSGVAEVGYEPRVGIALEDKDYEEEGLVMIVTRAVI